jgi:hypothetical protein
MSCTTRSPARAVFARALTNARSYPIVVVLPKWPSTIVSLPGITSLLHAWKRNRPKLRQTTVKPHSLLTEAVAGRHSTPSSISARRSATVTSVASPPAAGLIELSGDVAPGRALAAISRQVLLDQRPHVGERDELHDIGDDQRPRQG